MAGSVFEALGFLFADTRFGPRQVQMNLGNLKLRGEGGLRAVQRESDQCKRNRRARRFVALVPEKALDREAANFQK